MRTTLALALSTLVAAGAAGCGGGEDSEDVEPVGTTSTQSTTGPTGSSGASGASEVPPPATTEATPTPPSGGAPGPETKTTAPTTSTPVPNPGGASPDDPPVKTVPEGPDRTAPLPKQNPACKPGTGAGFPDRPQCEPVDGPDSNEDEGP